MSSIVFYHHPFSLYCAKVQWLLEAADVPHQSCRVDLTDRQQLGAVLSATGKVPAIRDGDFTLSESNAILRYIATSRQCFDLYPDNLQDRSLVDQWIDFIGQHISEPISDLIWFRHFGPRYGQVADPAVIARAELVFRRNVSYLDEHLKMGRNYIARPWPTLADGAFFPFFVTAYKAGIDWAKFPAIELWGQRFQRNAVAAKLSKQLVAV
jgi:glutathione S-transferase